MSLIQTLRGYIRPLQKKKPDYIRVNGARTSQLQLNIATKLHIAPRYINYKIGPYYADIVIPNRNVVIEINGAMWHPDKEKDIIRAKRIASYGYRVLIIQIHSGEPSAEYIRTQVRKLLNYKNRKTLYVNYYKNSY